MRLSRRDFLGRVGFGATLGLALAKGPQSLISELLFEPEAPLVTAHPLPSNPFVDGERALVAVIHGTDPAAMLAEGLRLLGGFDRLDLRGKRVLIKPNLLNDRPPPTTTNPLVVEALARMVRSSGATGVTVADSSGMIRFPTRENFIATGMQTAAERAGAGVLSLEDAPWVRIEPSAATIMRRYLVSKPVYDADLVLNVPVVKTHRFAEYSCALKNLVGIIHPRHRPSLAFLSGRWHERIAELNLAVHPKLTVADATRIMIDGGPTSGTAAEANLLLLSGDRVALDAVALALLRSFGAWSKDPGLTVWDQRQIKRAGELGLGASNAAQLSIVGASIDGERRRFERLLADLKREVGLPAS